MTIGVISYATATVLFLCLFLLLATNWRGRLQGLRLVIAVAISLLWALVATLLAGDRLPVPGSYHALEVLRSGAWLLFLLQLLGTVAADSRRTARLMAVLLPVFYGSCALLLLCDLFPMLPAALLPLEASVDLRIFGHLGLALGGLVLIEQLFRNTRPQERWATKFLYLGLGLIFAYDFFLYADALLFKRIDAAVWSARGLVNAIAVPLIAVAAARNPQWSPRVFVSRRLVFHTASIFGAGLYLLIMAGMGYYIRLYGGTWGTAIQLAFMFGSAALLIVLLFSGQMRAFLKVFLSKHFFEYKYDYRDEWLKFIGTLSTGASGVPLREQVIGAVAEILDSPGGLLWTRGRGDNFHPAATWNLSGDGLRMEPGDSSLVQFMEQRVWIVDLEEYYAEPEIYGDMTLPDWLVELPRAWLVVPLMQGERLQGFMVLARSRAYRQINWEDRDLLKTVGRQVASYLVLVDANEALMDAHQFDAFNRLSAYVVHDLKNIVAQLSLLVKNADRHKDNPAFVADAFATVDNAAQRMNRMLAQLRKGEAPQEERVSIPVAAAVEEVLQTRRQRRPMPVLLENDTSVTVRAGRDRFVAVLGHLVQNAQEATAADGRVEVRVRRDGALAIIEISDTGCGMDERFIRERLFRPFNTTKGNAGMGIGVYECREFIHDLGGEIDVTSRPGVGSTFFLRLPVTTAGSDNRETEQAVRC